MSARERLRGYYFVTDAGLSRAGNARDVASAAAAGVTVIQYRAKEGATRALCDEARALRALAGSALFLVNDRVDVAQAVEADGVHVGQDDMPCAMARSILGEDKIIGVTVHDVEEARRAEQDGADYVGVAPVFRTATKADAGAPGGLELVRAVRAAVGLPIVAIGGIDLANAPGVIAAGADAVCAISAVVKGADVAAEIRRFQALFGVLK
jgi:thiamine-phosphate pyrophosphorylase